MKACLDCLPCLARNAIDLARKSAQGDAALEAEIARSGMEILGSAAADGYPPPPLCYARRLIDNALAKSGGRVPDPWAKEKKRSTELALKLMEQMGLYTNGNCHNCSQITTANLDISALSRMLAHPSGSASPKLPSDASHLWRISSLQEINDSMPDFEKRLRLAVAGNILDFSIYADLDIAAAMETMATAFTKPICGGLVGSRVPRDRGHAGRVPLPGNDIVAELKRRMDEAKSILWIFDNCGEAVFDRLLMEPYREKLTLAVRGKPAFNDMTRAELEESGFPPDFAKGGVVSNDDGVPGVVDATCGEKFRAAFAAADLIVAKGQANFETMNERTDKPIAFLFLAKCPVVCRAVGAAPKTIQVLFVP